MTKKTDSFLFTRNFIFGVEDSLVSTVGLLSGIAAADIARPTIFLTGIVLIFVEAFSMGVGSFLSEEAAQEYTKNDQSLNVKSVTGALIMFFSYFASGFIPLFPYMILSVSIAFWISIVSSLVSLFLLGAVSAKFFRHKDLFHHGLRMLFFGGMAVLVGVVVGQLVKNF
jgi:VIT1/CCC1 family predicted Fe2+/Mn2+ transporter